jgi:hypothetical protein
MSFAQITFYAVVVDSGVVVSHLTNVAKPS